MLIPVSSTEISTKSQLGVKGQGARVKRTQRCSHRFQSARSSGWAPPLERRQGRRERATEMAKRYQTVLFDFGGTLDSDGVAWKERVHRHYRDEGLAVTMDQ